MHLYNIQLYDFLMIKTVRVRCPSHTAEKNILSVSNALGHYFLVDLRLRVHRCIGMHQLGKVGGAHSDAVCGVTSVGVINVCCMCKLVNDKCISNQKPLTI